MITAAPDQPLVQVEGLHVKFVTRDETVWAVNGVSFALKRGEVLCLIGESGSGQIQRGSVINRCAQDGDAQCDVDRTFEAGVLDHR